MLPAQEQAPAPGNLLVRAYRAWDRFWFKPADPTTLGLIRLLSGLLVLYVHLAYCFDLPAFFGKHAWIDLPTADKMRHESPYLAPSMEWDESAVLADADKQEDEKAREEWGVVASRIGQRGQYRWSIWFHVTDPVWMWISHIVILLIMACFALGFCSRITAALTWMAALCYIQRSPNVLFGLDTMMNLVLLYVMLGPNGAALSVDRLIRHWWAARRAKQAGSPAPVFGPPAPRVSANFAIRLLQINVCMIYLISGISKLQGGSWLEGTAVWSTMANYEFSPMRVPVYMELLRLLSANRVLWAAVITVLTYGTLAFELSFAYLVWNPRLRWTMIIAAVMMHMGIAICMGLVTFSLIMLIFVLSFVPPQSVRRLVEQFQGTAAYLPWPAGQSNQRAAVTSPRSAETVRA